MQLNFSEWPPHSRTDLELAGEASLSRKTAGSEIWPYRGRPATDGRLGIVSLRSRKDLELRGFLNHLQ